jgi:glycosyltransferase involved in cell wall biosynthesis
MNKKLVRITTVPMSLKYLLKGQMSFMSEKGYNVIMISSDGKDLKEVIDAEECNHFIIPLTRKITLLKDLYAVYKLLILLRQQKPDVVHTHTPKAGIIGMLASYLAKVPIRLHTVAGLPLMEVSGLKRRILNFVEKLTYKCATNVYPNSNGLKNIIIDNRLVNKEKLKVIGNGSSNGIDTSYFDSKLFSLLDKEVLKTNLGINNTDFIFIFVGRVVSDKGINELVKAFDKICLLEENIKLLLVGPFEDELDPLQKGTKLLINNNDNIISVGYQNDVRPYFSISNCLVFPSYREGFPNVVMQAGSMGLPSIVSNINGCNEIIQNNINGLVIKLKSVSAIYDAMLEMYTDKQLYNLIKENTRDIIKQRYERKLFWDLLLREYNDLNKK